MGCADRSAFDLSQHTKATGVRLVAEKRLPTPKTISLTEIVPNKGSIGKEFKKDAKLILEKLASLSIDEVPEVQNELNENG